MIGAKLPKRSERSIERWSRSRFVQDRSQDLGTIDLKHEKIVDGIAPQIETVYPRSKYEIDTAKFLRTKEPVASGLH